MIIRVKGEQAEFKIVISKICWVEIAENEIEIAFAVDNRICFRRDENPDALPRGQGEYIIDSKEFNNLRNKLTNLNILLK